MNKQQFFQTVSSRLSGLPQSDVEKSLDYYGEMIDDCIEDGLTETQAVMAMGSIDDIVAQILADASVLKTEKTKTDGHSRPLRGLEIALLVLGAPVWLPLLLAAVAIVLSLYIVLWSVVVTLYAADLSLAAGGVVGIAGAVVLALTGEFVQGLLLAGMGLVCVGAAALLFFGSNRITMGILKLSKRFALRVRSWLIRKEDAK